MAGTETGVTLISSSSFPLSDPSRVDSVAAADTGNYVTTRGKTMLAAISIDALRSERVQLRNQVTQYPVEDGYPVTDNVRPESEVLQIEGLITGSVVIPDDPGGGISRLIDVREALRSAWQTRDVITVVTGIDSYADMAIESIDMDRDNTSQFLVVRASLRKIRKVALQTATVPANVAPKVAGKAGQTAKSGGQVTPKDEPLRPTVLKGTKDAAVGGGSATAVIQAAKNKAAALFGGGFTGN